MLLSGATPKADAAVAYHASLVTPADFAAVTGPVALFQSDPKVDSQVNTTLYSYINQVCVCIHTYAYARVCVCVCLCVCVLCI